MNDKRIKEAVYVALTCGVFYGAAKYFKVDTNAALILGTVVGKILST